jgi:hypothetical protein
MDDLGMLLARRGLCFMEINEFITFAEFSYKKCGKWK